MLSMSTITPNSAERFTKGEPFNPWREICGFYPPEIVNRQRKLPGADGKLHRVTAGQKQLYDRCVRWTGEKVRFWRGFVSIAENLGRSERQIKRDMAALESFALMRHRRRRWDTNVYEFLWHSIFEQVDSAPPQEPGPKVTDTAHQEPVPKVTTVSRAKVTNPVKKGPLEVTTVSRKSCQEENHVNRTHPPTPQAPPSSSQPQLPGLCASADARVGESSLAKMGHSTVAQTRSGTRDCQTVPFGEWFAAWWAIYWRRESKKAAATAFRFHVKTPERFAQVMTATLAQTAAMLARAPDKRPCGDSWLKGERWNDESSAPAKPVAHEGRSLKASVMRVIGARLAKGEKPW